jgi:hypothetical protein
MPKHWYVDIQLELIRGAVEKATPEQKLELEEMAKAVDFEYLLQEVLAGRQGKKPVRAIGQHTAAQINLWLYQNERTDELERLLTIMGKEVEAAGGTEEKVRQMVGV